MKYSDRRPKHKWKIGKWTVVRFFHDYALYAKCDCGFEYCCGREDLCSGKFILEKTYHYCPECGKLNFDSKRDKKVKYEESEDSE